ncbi:MAG: MFS transporter, partial [Actinobacteria bacterium]|nr:MFS transporter [Actinomycetota bacterium]
YFGLGIVHTAGWVWLLLPLYGGYTALTDGVSKAWVADMLPSSKMGTGIGIYHAIYGAAVLIASLWAGAFWHGSGSLPLKVSGGVAAGLAVALVVFAKTFTRRGQVGSP